MVKSVKTPKKSDKNTRVVKKSAPVKRTSKRAAPAEKDVVVTSKTYTNMFAAYRAFWARGFTDWMGTSSRSEYWWTVLANMLVIGVVFVLMWIMSLNGISNTFEAFAGLCLLWALVLYGFAVIIPSMSMVLRRLHDGGFSSWWILLYPITWIPYLGYIAGVAMFIMMLMPTKTDGNPYHKFNH